MGIYIYRNRVVNVYFSSIPIYAEDVYKWGLSVVGDATRMCLRCEIVKIRGRWSFRLLFKRFYGLQEGFLRQKEIWIS